MEPLIQAQIMITPLTHIPHQWPYPHPFVSVAQSQVDFGDASPVSQWAPFVMGDVLALASPRREMWDLCPVMCEGEGMGRSLWRGQRGTWRPTRSQPVTGHHIRLRAGMRTFRTPRPARERDDVQKSKLPQTSPCDRRRWDSSAETLKKKRSLFCLANMSSSLALTDAANATEKIYVNLLKTRRMPHEHSVKWRKWLPLNDQLLMEIALPTYLFCNLPFRDITLNIHKLVNLKCFLH